MLKKENAIMLPTGSLANHVALLAVANRGDRILVEKNAHILINEKYDFVDKGSGLVPICFHLNEHYLIDPEEIEYLVKDNDIKAMCIENTHNYSSGTCLTVENIAAIAKIAHKHNIHIHMDGARLFNAAIALGVEAWQVVEHVDSVMFCVSKGLGAPVGSVLVGSDKFIHDAAVSRKFIGASMRQAGIVAAGGVYALKHNIERLAEDHANAHLLGELISGHPKLKFDQAAIQSNMVYVDVTPTGLNAQQVTTALAQRGLLVSKMTENEIRMVTNMNVSREQVIEAVKIIESYLNSVYTSDMV